MHIFSNIKWLFTKTLPSIHKNFDDDAICDYCGVDDYLNSYPSTGHTVCHTCQKKVLDLHLPKFKGGK